MGSIRVRAAAVAGVLTVDAAAHLLWATGSTWPAPDERALSLALLGTQASFAPGVVVPLALLLLTAAGVVLARSRWTTGGPWGRFLTLGTWALSAGLLLRAVAGVVWMFGIGVEPGGIFPWLNLAVYTPLCLVLGLATASVARYRRTAASRTSRDG